MRIPSGKTDVSAYFVAVDVTDLRTRETGLTGFTVVRSRNGAADVAYTTPTVTEIDGTTMPGVYALLIDEDTTIASGSDSEEYCVHITHASMAPVTRTIELYRRDTTSGQTIDVASGGVEVATFQAGAITAAAIATDAIDNDAIAANAVTEIQSGLATAAALATVETKIDTIDGIVDAILVDTAEIGTAGAGLTNINLPNQTMDIVGNITGNLSGSVGSVTGLTASNLDATISSRASQASVDDVPTNAEFASGLAAADDAVLSVLSTILGHIDTEIAAILADTNELQTDWANGGRLDLLIDAIKAKTDLVPGTQDGKTFAEMQVLIAAALLGKASGLDTNTAIFRAADDSKDRITATVDEFGNRSAVTLDAA